MDGDSTDNIYSKEIVMKLCLQILKLPTPCGINWFLDDHWIQVRE